MTDIQAAIAREQLRALPGFISWRRELALRYSAAFEDLAITLPDFTEEDLVFRYVIQHDKISASSLIRMLEQHGISARAPVFQPLHRVMEMDDTSMPYTSRTQDKAVSLPLYPALTDAEVKAHSQLKLIGLLSLLMRFAEHPGCRDSDHFSEPA